MADRVVVGGDDHLRLPRHAGHLGHGRRSAADGVLLHPGRVEVHAGTGRLDHVAGERRELDAPGAAAWHREHPVPRLGRLRGVVRAGHRHEVERHAEHVGELRRQAAVAVEAVVVGAAQRPAGHLLAQQLGAERPEPQDVDHGARVPALGEHRHRHHAADLLAQPARAAHRVEGLPDDIAVVAGGAGRPQLDGLGLQGPPQLAGCGDGVVALHLGVHQQGAEAVLGAAAVAADVGEQLVGAGVVDGGAVVGVLGEAGDVVVEGLGVGDGVGHHDEHRRGGQAVLFPALVRLVVLLVQGAESVAERGRRGAVAADRLGVGVAVEVAPRHLPVVAVVVHRHPGDLHQAGLDAVHQREIRGDPREHLRPRRGGGLDEHGRSGEVVHPPEPALVTERRQSAEPQRGALGLVGVGAGAAAFLRPVAVVGLVVEHADLGPLRQATQNAPQHGGGDFGVTASVSPAQQPAGVAGRLAEPVAALEGLEVHHPQPHPTQIAPQPRRHQRQLVVHVVGARRVQHGEALAHGVAGRDRHERGEVPAGMATVAAGRHVGRIPGDDHAHHCRLACTGGHLGAVADDAVVVLLGGVLDGLAGRVVAACHLGDPDQRLQRLHLGEEQPGHVVLAAPVMQESAGDGRGALVAIVSPGVDELADVVHCGVEVLGPERKNRLLDHVLPTLRHRQQRNARTAALGGAVERPIVDPQFPVPLRPLIRRVQHRLRNRITPGHARPVARNLSSDL